MSHRRAEPAAVTRPTDPVTVALLAGVLGSFVVWALALAAGLDERPAGLADEAPLTTYFGAINWWPYPFFFLLLLPFCNLCWHGFMEAWRDLVRTGVIRLDDGGDAPRAAVEALLGAIRRQRRWAAAMALVAAAAINAIDLARPVGVVFGEVGLRAQLEYACEQSDFWTKWLFEEFFEALPDAHPDPCEGGELDGGLAVLLDAHARIEPPLPAALFVLVTFVQQVSLVFFIALAMARLLLHTLLFAAADRLLPEARAHRIRLRLNAASPVREFGLERWNHVLNNFYWLASPIMLAAFLSRVATPAERYAPGQEMLGVVVPTLLLAPMVTTIVARQTRLPAVWPTLHSGEAGERYALQQLWPLDRNWSAKLGIILAFALAALLLGYELNRFANLAG